MASTPSSVLDALAGRKPNERGFVRVNCPVCEETVGSRDRAESLALNCRTGWWKCWRCQQEGPLSRAAREEWSAYAQPDEKKDAEEVVITLPEGRTGYYPLWCDPGATSFFCRRAREYLAGRHITPDIMREAEIGVVLDAWYGKLHIRHRVVAPLRDRAGKLCGWIARSYVGETPKVYYPPGMRRILYNESALYEDTNRPVFVVEGIFDAFALWPDAVACLGKPTDAHVAALVASKRPKIVALDGDAWHDAEALYLKLSILGAEATWFKLPAGLDPAEVKRKWFRRQMRRRERMGTIKGKTTARSFEMDLCGRTVLANWGEAQPKGLMIYDLELPEAEAVLEALNGTKIASAREKPAKESAATDTKKNGSSKKGQLELPATTASAAASDDEDEGEAAPKKSKKGEEAAAKNGKGKAAAASEDDEEDEDDDEPELPEELKSAVNMSQYVQWAISKKKAKDEDAVWAAIKPFMKASAYLQAQGAEKAERMARKRATKVFNPGDEAEA